MTENYKNTNIKSEIASKVDKDLLPPEKRIMGKFSYL